MDKNVKKVEMGKMAMVSEDLIPIDEQATTDAISTGSEDLAQDFVPVLSLHENPLETLVPKDEQGLCTDNEEDTFFEAERQGYISPVAGMARIENALDGLIYACVRVNDKGDRTIVFCQQYGDGSFSPRIRVEQSDLLLYAMSFRTGDKSLIAKANAILSKAYKDYFGKFSGDIILDMADILRVLVKAVGKLPVYHDTINIMDNPSMLYREIIKLIQGKDQTFTLPYGECVERKSYYCLLEEHIDALAQHLRVKRMALLKKLDEYHFLYLTPSSQGYQTKVRFPASDGNPSNIEWTYCLYKLDYFAQQKQLDSLKNP